MVTLEVTATVNWDQFMVSDLIKRVEGMLHELKHAGLIKDYQVVIPEPGVIVSKEEAEG